MHLGLDCSTQSFSALILDGDGESIIHEASVNFERDLPHYQTTSGFVTGPNADEVYSDPLMWLEALDLLLSRLQESGINLSQIKAVSGSGQQHATVYLNQTFQDALTSLGNAPQLKSHLATALSRQLSPIWMDRSTSTECTEIAAKLGGNDEVCRRSGSITTLRFSGPQIRKFAKQSPESWQQTSTVHLASSFLASVLTGKSVPIDHGDGAGMNLMNLHTAEWDPDLVAATAPKLLDKLPALAPSATIAGTISPYFCNQYGFSPDCQSVLWSGDNPNSLVGMNATTPGSMVISLGTSYTLFAAMDTPITDPTGFGHVFGNPLGGFMSLICFQEGSLTCEKLKNKLGLTWEEFDTQARSESPSPVRTLLDQQFTNMREKSDWMNLHPTTILVTGGGSQNTGIRQTISRIFNTPVQQISTTSSAALGAAKRAVASLK